MGYSLLLPASGEMAENVGEQEFDWDLPHKTKFLGSPGDHVGIKLALELLGLLTQSVPKYEAIRRS